MVSRGDVRLQNAIVIGLQENNYKYYVARKITLEELLDGLKTAYIALNWQIRNQGLAHLVMKEMRRVKNDVPKWWHWYFGWDKDYDITDYDTGHPLELAEKIVLASKKGIPFKKVKHLYEIAYAWAVAEDEEFESDRDYVLKLARFVAILSWADYDLPEFDTLKLYVMKLVNKNYSDDKELKFIVFGQSKILDDVQYLYDKPWMWLVWSDSVKG